MRHELDLTGGLNATRNRFVRRVGDWCPVVEAFVDGLQHGMVQTPAMADLRMKAHKIAGSGRIFGFPELLRRAAELEDELEEALFDETRRENSGSLIGAARDFLAVARPIPESLTSDDGMALAVEPEMGVIQTAVQQAQSRPAHILIVDDDDLIREALVQGLSPQGWSFAEAGSGLEAIATLFRSEHGSPDAPPDLILLDVDMPRMGGFEALRLMKSSPRWSATPVIMLTRRAEEVSLIRGIAVGAQDYITKPFDLGALSAKISDCLAANAARIVVAFGDRNTWQALAAGLQGLPVEVIYAKSARHALAELRENRTRLALIDGEFPDCDGKSIAEVVLADEDLRRKPVMSLHPAGSRNAMLQSLANGHQDSLLAPFDAEEVIHRLAAILQRRA